VPLRTEAENGRRLQPDTDVPYTDDRHMRTAGSGRTNNANPCHYKQSRETTAPRCAAAAPGATRFTSQRAVVRYLVRPIHPAWRGPLAIRAMRPAHKHTATVQLVLEPLSSTLCSDSTPATASPVSCVLSMSDVQSAVAYQTAHTSSCYHTCSCSRACACVLEYPPHAFQPPCVLIEPLTLACSFTKSCSPSPRQIYREVQPSAFG